MGILQHAGVIYQITAPSGERYVGMTLDYARRMSDYRNGRGHGAIGESIAKHGFDNHRKVKIAQGIPESSLPACELAFIAVIKPELNLVTARGGRLRHAESTKRRMSAAHRGKKFTPEHRAKIAAAKRGKKRSPETIAKMAAGHRGKKQPPEAVVKTAAANRGRKLSPEHRAQIAASLRGKTHSAATRARISKAKRGKKFTPAHRAAMSAAHAWRREVIAPRNAAIIAARESGKSVREVAAEFGVSERTVTRASRAAQGYKNYTPAENVKIYS